MEQQLNFVSMEERKDQESFEKKFPSVTHIYKPRGQALEYSAYATNPYSGCGHKCAYCYVPKILRISHAEFNESATLRKDFFKKLECDARKIRDYGGIDEQVMLSFTTDPYHPFDNSPTRDVIKMLHDYGMDVCTLTKGGSRALRDIDLFDPKRDSFASTLTALDDDFSKKWEGGAALPKDRLKTLETFHNAGIFTWASLEPTLSTEVSLQIIRETHTYVDHYKIGRANYLPMTKTTDWESYTHQIIDLCQKLGVSHYIKHDLQKYLPKGYVNELRITQHH